MNFKTLRRTLLWDLRTWGGKKGKKKKASYPGHNSISFSSKCSERSSGEKSKVLSNKRSFQGCNVLAAPSPSSVLHYRCLQACHSRTHRSAFLVFVQKTKQVRWIETAPCWCCCDRHASHAQPTVPGSLSLAFSLPFVFLCPVTWQWSGVINCSIKDTLRIQNTLDAQASRCTCCPITLKDKTPSCYWQSTCDFHHKTNGFIYST